MTARVGVITFPGTLDDVDAARAVRRAGAEAVSLWHADADLKGVDAVVVPGGFSYGDYLRCGAIAKFAPVMAESSTPRAAGMPVLGICNGFQVLCEAGLLPGALTRNAGLHFVCRDVWLEVASNTTAWTSRYELGRRPAGAAEVRRGPLCRRRERARQARGRRPRGVPLPRQPQRLDARHRGHRVGQRPGGRVDAAPRARDRGARPARPTTGSGCSTPRSIWCWPPNRLPPATAKCQKSSACRAQTRSLAVRASAPPRLPRCSRGTSASPAGTAAPCRRRGTGSRSTRRCPAADRNRRRGWTARTRRRSRAPR